MDLKPDNLLLNEAEEVKIADFGQSMAFESTDKIKKQYGTPAYSPPESFEGNEYSGKKADIWALGVTMYVFLFGKLPFSGNNLNEISSSIKNNKVDFSERKDLSSDCIEILTAIFSKDFIIRPSIIELKDFKWIKKDKQLKKYNDNKFINFIHNPEMEKVNKENDMRREKEHKRVEKNNRVLNKSFQSVSEAEQQDMSLKQQKEYFKKKRELELMKQYTEENENGNE
jgi:serine/threonine protein kinase